MDFIRSFDKICDAAKNIGIHKNNVWGVLNNYRKTAGGYIFKYLD